MEWYEEESPRPPVYFVGLDLGQAGDYTAISVLEQTPPVATPHWEHGPAVIYLGRHLDRLPLGMPYPQQVRHVAQLVRKLAQPQLVPDARGNYSYQGAYVHLAVDNTGVGRAVMDLLRDELHQTLAPFRALPRRTAGGQCSYPITITAGDRKHYEHGVWRVPKRDLVSVVQLLLQTQRIMFAESLPEVKTLSSELLNFRVKITQHAHDTYNAREGAHDDLVLAVACAAYAAEVLTTYAR